MASQALGAAPSSAWHELLRVTAISVKTSSIHLRVRFSTL